MVYLTPPQIRSLVIGIPFICILLTVYSLSTHSHKVAHKLQNPVTPNPDPSPPALPRHPLLKPDIKEEHVTVIENFPLAAAAHSPADLPPMPSWNVPPTPHVPEKTPLLIGFTRNWRLLQQVVVSYLTAGWPAEDIYVLENTGTMDANAHGRLSLQNPFFLNHTRLNLLGVNVAATPTLLTFAQLQNFMLYLAIREQWPQYFWSHMDVAAISNEDAEPYHSLYMNAVFALREATAPDYAVDPETGERGRWAQVLFAYDRLALVNTAAYVEVGGWDTHIPFYTTDCDMHERLEMVGFKRESKTAGHITDVGTSLDDLLVLYRKKAFPNATFIDPNPPGAYLDDKEGEPTVKQTSDAVLWDGTVDPSWAEEPRGGPSYFQILDTIEEMDHSKYRSPRGRNTWQGRQTGGQGEPYYRDPVGFETGLWMHIDHGRAVYAEKWGHRDCDLKAVGLRPEHAWRVEKDWEWQEKHKGEMPPGELDEQETEKKAA